MKALAEEKARLGDLAGGKAGSAAASSAAGDFPQRQGASHASRQAGTSLRQDPTECDPSHDHDTFTPRGPAAHGSGGGDEPRVRQRVRIRFSKQGDLRFVGHHDLARIVERLFRRAGVRPAYSQGFHPKPRFNFPSALALGIEGVHEVLEVELAEAMTGEELAARLASHAVPGLVIRSIEPLPPSAPPARVKRVVYCLEVPAERRAALQARLREVASSPSFPVHRPAKGKTFELREWVEELALEGGVLRMSLRVDPQGSLHPREVLAVLGLEDLESQGIPLVRADVELAS